MRCPQCNKFVPYDEAEPEINSEDFNPSDGTIQVNVRIVNNCGECGTELTETSFDMDDSVDEEIVKAHQGKGHELSMEVTANRTSRKDCGVNRKTGKPNKFKARYARTYYGAEVEVVISCQCSKESVATVMLQDECSASGMDQLV